MARTPRRRLTPAGSTTAALRENLPRPAAPAPVAQGLNKPVPGQSGRRRNPLAALGRFEPKFIADIVSELRKVSWPTLSETRYLTFVVSVVAITVGIFLGAVDLFFGWLIERLFF